MPDGACVYMNKDEHGIAACGIEQAYKAGATDFQNQSPVIYILSG